MSAKRGVRKGASKLKKVAERRVRIYEKDPCSMCGKGTSVERVFRVGETIGKAKSAHLVFFDKRHGWYCENGAQCPAVSDVKKFVRHSR